MLLNPSSEFDPSPLLTCGWHFYRLVTYFTCVLMLRLWGYRWGMKALPWKSSYAAVRLSSNLFHSRPASGCLLMEMGGHHNLTVISQQLRSHTVNRSLKGLKINKQNKPHCNNQIKSGFCTVLIFTWCTFILITNGKQIAASSFLISSSKESFPILQELVAGPG